ncbi:hypothetical protein MHK_000432, partial [Candidatus Magnetomorum sp. HK-1]
MLNQGSLFRSIKINEVYEAGGCLLQEFWSGHPKNGSGKIVGKGIRLLLIL